MGILIAPLVWGGCKDRTRQPDPEVTAELRTEGQGLFGRPLETPLVAPRILLDEPSSAPPSFADSLDEREPSAPVLSPSEGWSILVSRVPESSPASAPVLLDRIRTAGGLPGATLQRRAGGLVITLGSFSTPTSAQAQDALKRVRATEVNGARPYAFAFFAPPTGEGVTGANPEWDLRRVRSRLGSRAEYTLQVGVYARLSGGVPSADEVAQFRKAAEEAVTTLRGEGEQAFYYHGPTSSTITIGVFDETEHDSTVAPAMESRRLKSLRERHPNNLVNGAGFRETVQTDSGRSIRRLQRSQLVQIPKN